MCVFVVLTAIPEGVGSEAWLRGRPGSRRREETGTPLLQRQLSFMLQLHHHAHRIKDGGRDAAYLLQERSQVRSSVGRRPRGYRTAVGGGGTRGDAALSAHCWTANGQRQQLRGKDEYEIIISGFWIIVSEEGQIIFL